MYQPRAISARAGLDYADPCPHHHHDDEELPEEVTHKRQTAGTVTAHRIDKSHMPRSPHTYMTAVLHRSRRRCTWKKIQRKAARSRAKEHEVTTVASQEVGRHSCIEDETTQPGHQPQRLEASTTPLRRHSAV